MSLLIFGVVSANSTGSGSNNPNEKCKDKQEKAQEEKIQTLPAQIDYYDEGAYKQEAMGIDPSSSSRIAPAQIKSDSTASSISKYNYLFYFIYKYKFENKFGLDQIERLITDD